MYGSETASSIVSRSSVSHMPRGESSSALTKLGWMSIACWIVVYSPQIIENYQLKSGEGISVFFVIIWLIGDLANLFGALLAGLLPTIIILGAYYTVCDIILLIQIYYYRWTRSKELTASSLIPEAEVPGRIVSEETPLIPDRRGEAAHIKTERSDLAQGLIYGGALIFVLLTGAIAWAVDEYLHRDQPREPPKEIVEWRSQLLGWISAVMYIGARIPQIFKNFKTKCEGLSPALFLFSIAGNTTYVWAILAVSLDREHVTANAGWIAGSSLTVFLDVFVLSQFLYYRASSRAASRAEA